MLVYWENFLELYQIGLKIFCQFIMITEYCERYAKKENVAIPTLEDSDDDISNDDISDGQSTSSDDNIAGEADPWEDIYLSTVI